MTSGFEPSRGVIVMAHTGSLPSPPSAMSATKTFRHQDYELVCGAKVIDSGKFVPTLVVSKQVWPTRPRVIAVEKADYETEDVAIDAAYSQGVVWVQNFG